MSTWANARQFLGRIAGLGRGFAAFCVFLNPYLSTIYENIIFNLCIRDAEVARSNRVAPIRRKAL